MFCFYSNSSSDCASSLLAGVQYYLNQVDSLKRIGIQEIKEKEERGHCYRQVIKFLECIRGLDVNKVLRTLKHLHKNLTSEGD